MFETIRGHRPPEYDRGVGFVSLRAVEINLAAGTSITSFIKTIGIGNK